MRKSWSKRILNSWIARVGAPRPVILCYHRIVSSISQAQDSPAPELCVAQEQFAEQLAYLQKNREVVSLSNFVSFLQQGKLSNAHVAITFDDGYKDFITHALPVLLQYSIPATVFVSNGLITGASRPWWFDLSERVASQLLHNKVIPSQSEAFARGFSQRLIVTEYLKNCSMEAREQILSMIPAQHDAHLFMNVEELGSILQQRVVDLAEHTSRHCSLAYETEKVLEQEILECREFFRKQEIPILPMVAYPFGSYKQAGHREYACAAQLKSSAGLTTITGFCDVTSNIFALPRVPVDYRFSLTEFRIALSNFTQYLI